MKEIHAVSNLIADVKYGLNVQEEIVRSEELEGLDSVNRFLRELHDTNHSSTEEFIDSLAKKVSETHKRLYREGKTFSFEHRKNISKAMKVLYNHKVVSVEYVGKEDVYDLSVEKYHNFEIGRAHV